MNEQNARTSSAEHVVDYMPPPIATVAEIARFLRVQPNHVYAMFARGEIPGGKRIGRSIRFRTQIVVEWFEAEQDESHDWGRKRGAA